MLSKLRDFREDVSSPGSDVSLFLDRNSDVEELCFLRASGGVTTCREEGGENSRRRDTDFVSEYVS